jgi:hypothetical protein
MQSLFILFALLIKAISCVPSPNDVNSLPLTSRTDESDASDQSEWSAEEELQWEPTPLPQRTHASFIHSNN